MTLSLKAKIMGTVSVVVSMLILLGGISYWATKDLVITADDATTRLADAQNVQDAAFWAIKQYQNQADLIINKDIEIINEFEKSAKNFESAIKRVNEIVDTEEEKNGLKKLLLQRINLIKPLTMR